jgi:hypothetical protein
MLGQHFGPDQWHMIVHQMEIGIVGMGEIACYQDVDFWMFGLHGSKGSQHPGFVV